MTKSSHRIRVHAAPETIYQALTTKDGLQGWFTSQINGDLREGQEVTMGFDGEEPFCWRMTQLKPDTRVHWDCLQGPGAAKGTTVTYLLTGAGQNQTVVECDHDGWPEGHAAYATCNTLWGMLMGRLKEYAEGGKANPVYK